MSTSVSGTLLAPGSSQPPLQSIAERRSHSGGEDSEEDEEDEEGEGDEDEDEDESESESEDALDVIRRKVSHRVLSLDLISHIQVS